MPSDAELIRLCAEKVMGWPVKQYGHQADRDTTCLINGEVWITDDDAAHLFNREWNPLSSDSDAFMLVDAMTNNWYFDLTIRSEWEAIFQDGKLRYDATDPDRRRAIVLACLRAKGVNVDAE